MFTTLSPRYNTEDAPQFTDAENTFYKTATTTSLRQLRDQDQHTLDGRFYTNFGETLTKYIRLRIFNTLEYFNNRDYIDTYQYDR